MKNHASAGIAAALALALSSTALYAAEPHVHGAGTLQLVLEGGRLSAELRLPAINVVGFEHVPSDAKQEEAVKKAVALLQDARQVLTPRTPPNAPLRPVWWKAHCWNMDKPIMITTTTMKLTTMSTPISMSAMDSIAAAPQRSNRSSCVCFNNCPDWNVSMSTW